MSIRGGVALAGLLLAGSVAACSLTSLDGLTGGAGEDGGTGPVGSTGALGTGSSSGSGGTRPDDASSSYLTNDGAVADSTSGSTGTTGDDASTTPSSDAGGSTGTQSPDSGTVSEDAGSTGSGTDAGGGVKDSGTTTPVAFCASQSPAPRFCDDFDEGSLATPFDQVTGLSGAASLDTTYAQSPRDSMLSKVNANATAGNVDVAAYKSFSAQQGVAGTYTLAFDLRIDAGDTSSSSDAVVGAIQLWNGSATWDLELELFYDTSTSDFTASLTEDGAGNYVTHDASKHLAMGAWTRVAIAITLPAGTNGAAPATLSFNGAVVVSTTVSEKTSNPIPELIVGATYASSTSNGWQIRYDDVTF